MYCILYNIATRGCPFHVQNTEQPFSYKLKSLNVYKTRSYSLKFIQGFS